MLRSEHGDERTAVIEAVLFDRDGTLIADFPGNYDPDRVTLMPSALQALSVLRSHEYAIGVITNQPAADGAADSDDKLERMHRRLGEVFGIDAWFVCRHLETGRCTCRKPRPGLVFQAAEHFGISTAQCVVVGDIGSDMEAAVRAGAQAILVPTAATRPQEVLDAPAVATSLLEAARRIVGNAR